MAKAHAKTRTRASRDAKPVAAAPRLMQDALDYWVDTWQRSVLFWDVLRERGNGYLDHARGTAPRCWCSTMRSWPTVASSTHPVNYALSRILAPPGCPRPTPRKRPFVVIDPRAGHGPGIGGFKMDSEIGIAHAPGASVLLHHVLPRADAGQTIERVARAEHGFLEKVNALHPAAEGKPFVIGNCQGGWALMILAAAAPHLVGPILLAGSPISYWAGVEGRIPMRYSGGLLGGSWLASFAGDLGHGRFRRRLSGEQFRELYPAILWTSSTTSTRRSIPSASAFSSSSAGGAALLLNKAEIEWITQNLSSATASPRAM